MFGTGFRTQFKGASAQRRHLGNAKTSRASRLRVFSAVTLVSLVSLATSCSSTTGSAGGTAQVDIVQQFSGPDASYGPLLMSGCLPAAYLINKAGGVAGGHKLTCVGVDTVGDPIDGVAAVRKALAVSKPAGVLGPDSATAEAIVPILEQAHVTMMSGSGGIQWDHNTNQYFWRVVPGDSTQGAAVAVAGYEAGYRRAAVIFSNDPASQTEVPALISDFRALGGTITINESITPNQPSYQAEAAKLLATNPQVIFTEADPHTGGTLWANIKGLETHPIPVVGTATELITPFIKALIASVGASYYSKNFTAMNFYSSKSPPGLSLFNTALMAKGVRVPDAKQYLGSSFSYSFYDATNILALAMEAAHSISPTKYNSYIAQVTGVQGGKHLIVNSFASGKAALDKGEKITYVGPSGAIAFNKYHSTLAPFVVVHFRPSGAEYDGKVISLSEMLKAGA